MEKIEIGEVFTISDENNDEQEMEVIATMTLKGTEYVAVGFHEDLKQETEEDVDVFFLKVDEDGTFSAIESDEEFDEVSAEFDRLMDEEEEADKE
ncbi:DUF1292 domain-containing protein [Anaerobacillus sp. MEB173]|uniref:DUF1292 domain-containing protein n=1 Tax=Anaerobacillus sp. MEB173 TaxID=3383345 RepID=UPI003F91164A